MSRARASPAEAILNSVHRLQSNVSVRAAEAAYLVVVLGGFYLIALVRLVDPFGEGPTHQLLNAIPIAGQIALTVIGPFAIIVLEWLSALAQLRQEPDVDAWALERKLRYVLEATSIVRTTAAFTYLPLLPVSFFWAVVAILHHLPYWPVPALVGLIDAAVIVAINRYIT